MTATMLPADVILIDWGTTNARAYRRAAGGTGVESRRLPRGIRQVPQGGFPAALAELLGPWDDGGDPPIVMSGMIGSRQGWVEVPYCPCPARLEDLAARLQPIPGRSSIRIVPGVSRAGGGRHDVMRGEEVQAFGAVGDSRHAVLCLPGTHSKWAVVEAGRIARFATFMTGELFAVLREHSILGRLMVGDTHILDAFQRGVVYGSRSGAGLLKHLFSARTLPLLERLPAAHVASYLSGLLIGHEIAEASTWIGSPHVAASSPTIVGAATLVQRYAEALAILGIDGRTGPADAAVVGIRRILIAAGPLAAHR